MTGWAWWAWRKLNACHNCCMGQIPFMDMGNGYWCTSGYHVPGSYNGLCLLSRYWTVYLLFHIMFIHSLMMQVSSTVVKLRKEVPRTFILSNNHIPSKTYWDLAVNRALELIDRSNLALIKVLYNLSAVLCLSLIVFEYSVSLLVKINLLQHPPPTCLLFGFSLFSINESILSWKLRLY